MSPATGAVAQAWIEPRADDPEAASALLVARRDLEAGRGLVGVRRLRLFELRGPLPDAADLADRLHESTQFYNPAKERCTVRAAAGDAAPLAPGEVAVLVVERGGARRAGAERWWRHAVGSAVEVAEATVWVLRFEAGADAPARARELAAVRDRRHGLLCNPNFQDWSLATERVPLPWLPDARRGPDEETP
jgi:hypothetical protein